MRAKVLPISAISAAVIPLLLFALGSSNSLFLIVLFCAWIASSLILLFLAFSGLSPKVNDVRVFLTLLGCWIILPLLMCFLPPVARDELTQHLALPKLWLSGNALRPITQLVVSYFPQWTEVLYTGALATGFESLAKLVHFLLGLLVLFIPLLLVDPAQTRHRNAALWIALLWLATPVFYALLSVAYSDLGCLAALLAGVLLWERWLEEETFGDWRKLSGASFFFGLALAIKYTALPIAVLFVALSVIEVFRRRHNGTPDVYLQLLALIPLLIAPLPHFAINFLETSNPTYPLLHRLWTGTDAETGSIVSPWRMRALVYRETPPEQLLIPLRIFFTGRFDDPARFDGVLNPLWLAFPLLFYWSVARKPDRRERYLLLLSLGTLLITFASASARARYYLPALIPIEAIALRRLPSIEWNALRRKIALALGIIGLLFGLVHEVAVASARDWIPYLSGKLSRKDYLRHHIAEYGALEIVREKTPPESRIYPILVANRIYYLDRPFHLDRSFFPETIERLAKESDSANEIAAGLQALGIDYLLYPPVSLSKTLRGDLDSAAYLRAQGFFAELCRVVGTAPPFQVCSVRAP